MHSIVFRELKRIIGGLKISGRVLEVGAVPKDSCLLTLEELAGCEKIGINFDPACEYGNFRILQMSGNDMRAFPDSHFDAVLSNATLEHDGRFWLTCAEIRRVLKPGGAAVIGVPGFDNSANLKGLNLPLNSKSAADDFESATLTFRYHGYPYDYYRFSHSAVREIFFDGFRDVKIANVMRPPRLIGYGWKAG